MEKTKKAQAIKKLEAELKEEKLAEAQRCVLSLHGVSIHRRDADLSRVAGHRRKEITMERKKAAEERRRLEEDKAKVRTELDLELRHSRFLSPHPRAPPCLGTRQQSTHALYYRWAHARLPGCAAGQGAPRKSIIDPLSGCATLFGRVPPCVFLRLIH